MNYPKKGAWPGSCDTLSRLTYHAWLCVVRFQCFDSVGCFSTEYLFGEPSKLGVTAEKYADQTKMEHTRTAMIIMIIVIVVIQILLL